MYIKASGGQMNIYLYIFFLICSRSLRLVIISTIWECNLGSYGDNGKELLKHDTIKKCVRACVNFS